MAQVAIRRTNLAWLAAGPIGLAYGLAALGVALGAGAFTTFAGRVPAVATGAGLALFGAAVASAFGPAGRRTGALYLIAGVLWFAPVWVGWSDGPPLIRAVAALAAPFLLPGFLYLVAAYPEGRIPWGASRTLVVVVSAGVGLSAVVHALFRDPLLDPNCWDNCTTNAFLLHPVPGLVHSVDVMDRWLAAGAGIALIAIGARRLAEASGPARRSLWPILVGAAVVGAGTVAHAVALANAPERPADPAFQAFFLVLAAGVALVAAGPVLAVTRAGLQRRAVERIVADLGDAPGPGSLEAALSRVVGDPALSIAYWVPSSSRFVDARGHPVAEPGGGSQSGVTTLARDGRPVAAISHAAPAEDVVRRLGAAVRLAMDNERLQAEALSQAEDIRASRARIVEAGDAERRRLERDLHDGAQQRLLALSYHLRVARVAAEADGDAAAELFANVTDQALQALGELRGLAHGIYPAILSEAGLEPALATMADSAPLPVEVSLPVEDRLPPQVETAAFVVVSESIDDATARGASGATVHIDREGDRLVIAFRDDGAPRTSAMVHVADRVGALGGDVRLGPHVLHAEIPCE